MWAKSKIWFSHQWHLVTARSAIGPKLGPLYMQHGNHWMSNVIFRLNFKAENISNKILIYFQKLKRLVYSVTYLAWGNHKSLQTTSKPNFQLTASSGRFLVFWTMTTARNWTKLVVWFWNSPLLYFIWTSSLLVNEEGVCFLTFSRTQVWKDTQERNRTWV